MTAVHPAISMRGITRSFGDTVANREVDLDVPPQTVHAIIGENGAGKSTLLRIAYGELRADRGEISLKGQGVATHRHTPRLAIERGVGMVHQHFMLVEPLTVAENLILGREPHRAGLLDKRAMLESVAAALQRFNLDVDAEARVESLSVGQKQRVEIARVLYQGCDVLILDEPTAVLTPQEVETLFANLRDLVADGVTIALVTHKLDEVLDIADEVTVMRHGSVVETMTLRRDGVRDVEVTAESIARAMVGRPVLLEVDRKPAKPGDQVLRVEHLACDRPGGGSAIKDLSFEIRSGEILGVAGIEGNGQSELLECIAGLRGTSSGRICLGKDDISRETVSERFRLGLGHIPEDRHRRALVLDMSTEENLMLGRQGEFTAPFRIDAAKLREFARERIRDSDIRPEDPSAICRGLSGGNQQKVVVARELSRSKLRCLLCAQPTRGVDIGAIEAIHRRLVAARDAGVAILLVSAELSELQALADRLLVLRRGEIVLSLGSSELVEATARERIGLAMTAGEGAA